MTDAIRLRRSALYLPASNPRAIEKSRTLDADIVILDLEDAVAPEAKDLARRRAIEAVDAGGYGDREVVIRVNALDTPWGAEDIAAAAASRADAVLVPKISSVENVARHRALLGAMPLWVMVETCAAVLGIERIAASGPACLVMGLNDLAKEMRARLSPERTAFHPALAATVMAARAAGIAALDGVSNEIGDQAALGRACAQSAEFGFDGKTMIHPDQIAACNAALGPSAEDVAHARAILDAFADPANAGKGALRVAGRMVERLHLAEAGRVVAIAEAIGARRA